MKTGELRTIRINGRAVAGTYLGKGMFCTAYVRQDTGKVVCFCKDEDNSKGILNDCERLKHLPDVQRIDNADDKTYVYEMPLYLPLTAKHTEAWKQFKILQKLREDACSWFYKTYPRRELFELGHALNWRMEELTDTSELPGSIKAAIAELVNSSANYGDEYIFDGFCKPNCKVDEEGDLILLDPMFNCRELYNKRKGIS